MTSMSSTAQCVSKLKFKVLAEPPEDELQNTSAGESNLPYKQLNNLEWKGDVGTLPGSSFKVISCLASISLFQTLRRQFKVNDFGLLEIADDGGFVLPPNKGANMAEVAANEEEVSKCLNCNCYGLASNFHSPNYCSSTCAKDHQPPSLEPELPPSSDVVHSPVATPQLDPASDEGDIRGKKRKRKSKKAISAKFITDTEEQDEKSQVLDPPSATASVKSISTTDTKSCSFSWPKYLEETKALGASEKLFPDAFPTRNNPFQIGMKLEGVDPEHQSLFCVLSVVQVVGYRIRLHFDGYSSGYDFWANANSTTLFPPGWCAKNGQTLQPPKGFPSFNWDAYLKYTDAQPAPEDAFTVPQPQTDMHFVFEKGMKLEAVDKKNSSLICVASVANVMPPDKFLVHFDSWDEQYDYWADPSSPYVHPVGHCESRERPLTAPCDFNAKEKFSWESYLAKTNSTAVPLKAFMPRLPAGYRTGMKLEAVDPRNPALIRVASVVAIRNHRIKLHFDGWSSDLDFWCDEDSPDIHPPTWTQKTGHPLQPPRPDGIAPAAAVNPEGEACPIPGCLGLGHAQYMLHTMHFSAQHCPYASCNIKKDFTPLDRLSVISLSNNDGLVPPPNDWTDPEVKIQTPKSFWDERRPVSPNPTAPQSPTPPHLVTAPFPVTTSSSTSPPVSSITPPNPTAIQSSVYTLPPLPNPNVVTPFCWSIQVKIFTDEVKKEQVRQWEPSQVAEYVKRCCGCDNRIAETFIEQKVDGAAFLLMNQNDLVDLIHMKLGPAIKIYNAILALVQQQTDEI